MLKSQFRVFAQTALLLQFFTSPIEFDDFLSTPAFIGLQICAAKKKARGPPLAPQRRRRGSWI